MILTSENRSQRASVKRHIPVDFHCFADDILSDQPWLGVKARIEDIEDAARTSECINENALAYLIAAILAKSGETGEALKRIDDRLEFIDENTEIDNINLVNLKITILSRFERWEEVIEVSEKGIRIAPDFEPFWHSKAGALDSLERDAEADLCYKKAISCEGHCSMLHLAYANFLTRNDREEEALIQIDKTIEIEPSCVEALTTKASIHMTQKEEKKAKLLFESAILLDANNLDALYGLAFIFLECENNPRAATQLINGIIRIDPEDERALRMKADRLVEEPNEAIRIYDGILAKNPEDTDALCGKAGRLIEIGQCDEASTILESMKCRCPKYEDCRLWLTRLARIQLRLGNISGAEKLIEGIRYDKRDRELPILRREIEQAKSKRIGK